MAEKPEMQCSKCNLWIPSSANALLVPKHSVKKRGVTGECLGSGRAPKSRRGFPKPNTNKW